MLWWCLIAIAIVGSCSGCTWREKRIGNALDSGRVDIAMLLSVCHDCHCHCWIAFQLLLWCSGCTWREGRVGNTLDIERVNIVDVDEGLLRSETNKHKYELDCNCN